MTNKNRNFRNKFKKRTIKNYNKIYVTKVIYVNPMNKFDATNAK